MCNSVAVSALLINQKSVNLYTTRYTTWFSPSRARELILDYLFWEHKSS
jgi:hypothetical protein